ncbi:hypothetical protein SprV_0100208100 [Sparganum proliferum]
MAKSSEQAPPSTKQFGSPLPKPEWGIERYECADSSMSIVNDSKDDSIPTHISHASRPRRKPSGGMQQQPGNVNLTSFSHLCRKPPNNNPPRQRSSHCCCPAATNPRHSRPVPTPVTSSVGTTTSHHRRHHNIPPTSHQLLP